MRFDELKQDYPSNRYCITARGGVVATGSNLASAAGLEILKKGGNAIDAAIATAAALTVVEPTANGIGSDAFALVYVKDKLYGLNASGYAPSKISAKEVLKNHDTMPKHGWTPITVPGAPKAWCELSKRFGKLSLEECLAPAIRYAYDGYPLSPMLGKMFLASTKRFKEEFKDDPKFKEWFKVFTKDGEPYKFGEMIYLKDHAKTLDLIAKTKGEAFYKGEIAEAIVRQSTRDGGYFSLDDLKNYEASWVEPISVKYHGYDVYEIPPNGQGIVALMALNALKGSNFQSRDENTFHHQFEAIKLAFANAMHYVSDPRYMGIDYHDLLSDEYAKMMAEKIKDQAGIYSPIEPPKSGTVYLCTADKEGNMVSYIQSNYMGFGSGIVIEGYGVAMQNRGADFSLDEHHYNFLRPLKKTYHTIIPGFLMEGDKPIGPFGVMGGYMQPQGHLQVVMNLIDFHMNPQMALDAPRWQWVKEDQFIVEPDFDKKIVEELKKRGHKITYAKDRVSFGRGQIILRLDNGVYVAGCESRTDSNIACY